MEISYEGLRVDTSLLIVHLIMHGDATMCTYDIYIGMYANTGVSISVRTWRVEFNQLVLGLWTAGIYADGEEKACSYLFLKGS